MLFTQSLFIINDVDDDDGPCRGCYSLLILAALAMDVIISTFVHISYNVT
jgi:hypothetical protein